MFGPLRNETVNLKTDSKTLSLPADVLWGYECVTNEPQRTSAGRLQNSVLQNTEIKI